MYHREVLCVFKRTGAGERWVGENRKTKKWIASTVSREIVVWSGKRMSELKPKPEQKDFKALLCPQDTSLNEEKSPPWVAEVMNFGFQHVFPVCFFSSLIKGEVISHSQGERRETSYAQLHECLLAGKKDWSFCKACGSRAEPKLRTPGNQIKHPR